MFRFIGATRPALSGWEAVVLKTSRDWTLVEGGRADKIRSGPIARVGVNRRRRERRCLSFKGVLRIARRANSHAEQRAKTKCRRD